MLDTDTLGGGIGTLSGRRTVRYMLVHEEDGTAPVVSIDFRFHRLRHGKRLPLMPKIEIEPRIAAAMKRLEKLIMVVDDAQPTLEKIGEKLAKTTRSRFHSGKAPSGKYWRRSKRARRRRRKTLVDTGHLRDSITVKADSKEVAVGTDVWYGRLHQRGGRTTAQYKRRQGRTRGPAIPKVPRFNPSASSAQAMLKSSLRREAGRARAARQAARNVRLPARRFLGVSKKDRKNVTDVVMGALKEALR